MKIILLLLLLVTANFKAQNSKDKESLKKCCETYGKKICSSDEDHDGVPFYIDRCPKESGTRQNNGCPILGLKPIDTTRTADLDGVHIVGKPNPMGGCGQIINAELLNSITK
ncbi:hypothetical protein [Chryseobacterium sp. SIMBA_028]|uniref:hypothetical protein n=1 Tax=Chryseobacterium sp. SIMBA_028 TaxID=3085771 RepID=UPI00397C223F